MEIQNILFAVCAFLPIELKASLLSYIENETILDYDREAELALQRLTTGDVDVNQLTTAWTRSYVEVKAHFCNIVLTISISIMSINIYNFQVYT